MVNPEPVSGSEDGHALSIFYFILYNVSSINLTRLPGKTSLPLNLISVARGAGDPRDLRHEAPAFITPHCPLSPFLFCPCVSLSLPAPRSPRVQQQR